MSDGSKEQMKKIYICGKVTGNVDYFLDFSYVEDRLRFYGYEPVNPVTLIDIVDDEPWESAMKIAITAMLGCDGVALLSNWQDSKGAKIEASLAAQIGIEVRPYNEWH